MVERVNSETCHMFTITPQNFKSTYMEAQLPCMELQTHGVNENNQRFRGTLQILTVNWTARSFQAIVVCFTLSDTPRIFVLVFRVFIIDSGNTSKELRLTWLQWDLVLPQEYSVDSAEYSTRVHVSEWSFSF